MSIDPDDQDARFRADLLARVNTCGVDADHVSVRYEDELQSHVVRIEGGPLTKAQVLGLMTATWACGDLEFADMANTHLHREAMSRAGAGLMKAQAADLLLRHPDFPRFDPSRQALTDYARELEAYCGFEPGTALFVTDSGSLNVGPLKRPVDFERFNRLHEAVTMGMADDGVRVFLIGTDGADPSD